MSTAIACLSIDGYEQYEPRKEAELTSDEKLLVYYRPLDYAIIQEGEDHIARFTQEAQIRRKGEKAVLRRKQKMLDYEAKSKQPPEFVYLRNSVSLKGLPPGEYEYDIILKDENRPGPSATQSLRFRVVAAALPKSDSN